MIYQGAIGDVEVMMILLREGREKPMGYSSSSEVQVTLSGRL
jgi:hypothetical protein